MQGERKDYYSKKNYNNKHWDNRKQEQKHYVKKTPKIEPSKEPGFTGPPENWFNDEEFKKSMTGGISDKDKHDYYYGSYSNYYIHEEMLKDTVRTGTYQRAIESNKEDFKDKIVLDIGAGTGILSIFAARAGAKHVYAIENAEIALFAEEIIKQNKLSDKITVIKGKMEEIQLPVNQVDIIISEWMGYFLLYEAMLDTILFARDKYLVPGGKILPDKCKMYLAALEDEQYKSQKIGFWKNVYGVDMSCLAQTAMKEPLVDSVNGEMVCSKQWQILEIDLTKMKKEDTDFSSEYTLVMNRNDKVHGLIAWFDAEFSDLQHPITLSTSPFKKYTHWKQVVFYMDHNLTVDEGEVLHGSIAVKKSKNNFRELDIKISYHFDGYHTQKDFVQMYKLR